METKNQICKDCDFIHSKSISCIKPKNQGCGRRFRAKRFQKPTFTKPDYYISVIICGNNLSHMLCPDCKPLTNWIK